jgi:ABC-type enterochelin transport system permease subunit
MKFRNIVKKYAAPVAALSAATGTAFAGMGADAATALSSAQTEGITAGTAVVGLVAALVVVGVVIGLIKKA